MYRSPIEISKIQEDLDIAFEDGVFKAVRKVGINVDKDELLKALAYDRGQYEQGYRDALKEQPQWTSVKDRLPKVYNAYLAVVNGEVEEVIFCPTSMKRQRWSHCIAEGFEFLEDDSVTHWMPMPKPPEVKQNETD